MITEFRDNHGNSTPRKGFYSLYSTKKAKKVEVAEVDTLSQPEINLESESSTKKPSGFYSLVSTRKKPKINLEGKNSLYLPGGREYIYNDLSFDKSKTKIFASTEMNRGWHVELDSLKTHAQHIAEVKEKLAEWEANKDNPKLKTKKPYRDVNSIFQIDTEFNFNEQSLDLQEIKDLLIQETRDHHTTQIKLLPGIDGVASKIMFATKTFAKLFNPIMKSKGYQELPVLSERDCDFFDYASLVTDIEWKVSTSVNDAYLNSLPKFYLSLSAHNAEAEINLVFHGQLLRRVLELQANYSVDEGIIRRNKVLIAFSYITVFGQKTLVDWVSLKAVVTIDGVDYHLCLRIIDTIKAHGIVSLSNFAQASNYKLDAKDFLSKLEKSNILKTALEHPEKFIPYSLGDPCNLEIMYSYFEEIKKMYSELGLSSVLPPSLTIGSTVVDLDYATIAENLDFKGEDWQKKTKEFIEKEIQPFSPAATIKNSTHSSAILAKGFGGRIGQNQPTEVVIERTFKKDLRNRQDYGIKLKSHPNTQFKLRKIKGKYDCVIVVDIDISGCYAESQRVQVLPIGKPIVGGLSLDTVSGNNYPSLGKFLTACKVDVKTLTSKKFANYEDYQENWHLWGELEYGAFNLVIEVPELTEQCDLLPSWIHPGKKVNHKMLCKLLSDAVKGDDKAIDKIKQGHTKKLFNQLDISPVNFDCLEWIMFHASDKLRKELLEKAKVVAFVIYPKSYRITSNSKDIKARMLDCQKQLDDKRANWKPTNTLNLDFGDNFALYSEQYRDCHYWYGETLGDLVINKIISKRKVAQWIRKKCPLDLLYKLFNNTHFGVSISPLFAISNICVGNNITARCRVLAWCMEKALQGYPTITDGCFFQLNQVLKVYNRFINSNCINMDSPNSPLSLENYGLQALPYNFCFEDRNFNYTAKTKEYVMKNKRIYALCEITQTHKISGITATFEALSPLNRIIRWENGKAIKTSIKDILAIQAKLYIQACFPLMTVVWMDATSIKVVALEDKFNQLPSDEKKPEMVITIEEKRYGLADFEIKDYYFAAANHGMANYLLINEIAVIRGKDVKNPENEKLVKQYIKSNHHIVGWRDVKLENSNCDWNIKIEIDYNLAYRGYESSKPHVAIVNCDNLLYKTDRYKSDNPAKDFMVNLSKNGNAVPRQNTAIKLRSISCGDYHNNPKKFNELTFKPGDQMKICILFTEFSLSQFTLRNKTQYFAWLDDITHSKNKYGQSLEAWFINKDGTLRFKDMSLWCADAIERGIKSPVKELQSYGKRSKPKVGSPIINLTENDRYHPEWFVYQKVKYCLATGDLIQELSEVELDNSTDNDME